ncbi:MAG: SDR family oxidoreductase [Candidatus Thorarchaeota archaeon]
MKDKTILVTAASRGLGYGVAKALVAEGAKVFICGRNEDSLKQAVSSLGTTVQYIVADVSEKDDIKRLIETVGSSVDRLDGLFVNAGGPKPGEFSDLPDEAWEQAFNLTLMSAVRLTREALSLLENSDHPTILYSTSISVKEPIKNLLLSNAMRPAVIGMMRTISDEVGPRGIRVNAVCPGYIYTQRIEELMAASKTGDTDPAETITARIPLGRMGKPDEFGAVCAFLLSPLASYVHGALLLVDGGLYRGMM